MSAPSLVQPEMVGTDPERVQAIVEYVENQMESKINWYRRKKQGKQLASKAIRFIALLSVIVGGLMPLWSDATLGINSYKAGYMFLGVGGALLLFDRMFGISSGWMRFMVAAQQLEALRDDFRLASTAIRGRNPQESKELLADAARCAQEYLNRTHAIVLDETGKWVSEFESSIARLEKISSPDSTHKGAK